MNATNYVSANGQEIKFIIATDDELRSLKGVVYLFWNNANQKVHVGQSIVSFYSRYSVNPNLWWKEASNDHLKKALLKYGYKNFCIMILESNIKEQVLLDFLESFYINKFNSMNPLFGYNKTTGGCTNNRFSPEILKKLSENNYRGTREERQQNFIKEANRIHPGLYDYSKVNYINCDKKIEIFCLKCQKFFSQTPYSHVKGRCGCPTCLSSPNLRNKKERFDRFVARAYRKFGNKYQYDFDSFGRPRDSFKIKCNNCNIQFLKSQRLHMRSDLGCCPKCSQKAKNVKRRKLVAKIDPITNEILEIFESYCAAKLKYGDVSIQYAIEKNKSAGGFKWKYISNNTK